MKKFDSLKTLKNFLSSEKDEWSRWIVRFIHVNSEHEWISLVQLLRDFVAETWSLSQYCQERDVLPDLSLLLSQLRLIKQSILLVPLPAHMRVTRPDLWASFIQELKRIVLEEDPEKRGYLRIYVPLYGLLDQFCKLDQEDQRFEEVFLLVEDETKTFSVSKVIVVNKQLSNLLSCLRESEVTIVQSYKKYLEYWEKVFSPRERIFLFTELAGVNGHPFQEGIEVLTGAFEALEVFCQDWNDYHLEEEWGQREYWEELLQKCIDASFMNSLRNILQIGPHDKVESVLRLWRDANRFKKWLITLWLFLQRQKRDYLELIFEKGFLQPEDFEERVVNALFLMKDLKEDSQQYWEIYEERKLYLQAMQIRTLPSSFWERFEAQFEELLEGLCFLTDCTECEKEKVIEIVGNAVNKGVAHSEIRSVLQKIYPELSWYMEWNAVKDIDVLADLNLKAYFSEYVAQKIADTVRPEFVEQRVEYLAKEKGAWWRELGPVRDIVNHLCKENERTFLYWIDGLGLEYLGYLNGYLSNKKELVYAIHVGYANLPTITECNKNFLEDKKNVHAFRKLDELKHSNQYSYPKSIVAELSLLQKALEEAISYLDRYAKVLIVSDHGTSRLAVLFAKNCPSFSYKPGEEAEVKRYGRYCVDEHHKYEDKIPGCIDWGIYHVFANYHRFATQGGSAGEVHGGATLEEVLVPVLEIQRCVEAPKEISYSIKLKENLVRLEPGKKPRIYFEIIPETEDLVMVQVEDKEYICSREKSFWFFEVGTKQRVIQGTVVVGGRKVGVIEVLVQRGIYERDDM